MSQPAYKLDSDSSPLISPRAFVNQLSSEAMASTCLRHVFFRKLLTDGYADPAEAYRFYAFQHRTYVVHSPQYISAVAVRLADDRHRSILFEIHQEESGARGDSDYMYTDYMTACGVDGAYQRATPLLPASQEWAQSFQELCVSGRPEVALGAFAFGAALILPAIYRQLESAATQLNLAPEAVTYLAERQDIWSARSESLLDIARDLSADPETRQELRSGALRALALRGMFLDAVDEALQTPSRSTP